MRKKNKTGGIIRPDFKLYYKAMVAKTVWYQHKSKHAVEWNRIEKEQKSKHLQLINLNKGAKYIQWGERSLFSKWFWGSWIATHKRMKMEHYLTLYIKVNLEWIIDLK